MRNSCKFDAHFEWIPPSVNMLLRTLRRNGRGLRYIKRMHGKRLQLTSSEQSFGKERWRMGLVGCPPPCKLILVCGVSCEWPFSSLSSPVLRRFFPGFSLLSKLNQELEMGTRISVSISNVSLFKNGSLSSLQERTRKSKTRTKLFFFCSHTQFREPFFTNIFPFSWCPKLAARIAEAT